MTTVHEDYCGYPDDCNCCKVSPERMPVEELALILHSKTDDLAFMKALQREERRWRRGSNARSLVHLRNVMHCVARVLDGHAALADAEESER